MSVISIAERGLLPDPLIRLGIRGLLRQRLHTEARAQARAAGPDGLIGALAASPVAIETDAANRQHYEVPAAFFEAVLGPRLKYSCSYWQSGAGDLAEAEDAMLELYAQRALLEDGQRVLDLGCGWGSLSLWLAQRQPSSQVTAVSNSRTQRQFIEARARELGVSDRLRVVTADVNRFEPEGRYDRIVSIEMFEHVRNYRVLLRRISGWLEDDGRLFVHLFCHRRYAYPFETDGDGNWMGRHFFTGGLMPALGTLARFQDDLELEQVWPVSGVNYQRTAEAWLERLDARSEEVLALLAGRAGADDPGLQLQRWRMFFMACAELFGYRGGREWLVGHYRFRQPRRDAERLVS